MVSPSPDRHEPPALNERDLADRLDEADHSPSASAMKNQVVGLIAAVAYLRGPLIVLNSLTCVIAMLP